MGFELSRNTRISFSPASVSNATGRIDGPILDMDGWESVAFLAFVTATNAGTDSVLGMRVGTASDAMSDTTGVQRFAAGGIYLDVARPGKRFVQGQMRCTVSGDCRGLVSIQYNPRSATGQPTTDHPASTTGRRIYTPDTGTMSAT